MFRLQIGVAQVAKIFVVAAVLAVTVAELVLVEIPKVTAATPAGTELQVSVGKIGLPAESITSATSAWVFVGARLNVVFELAASWTWIETTGHTRAGCGMLLSPATDA